MKKLVLPILGVAMISMICAVNARSSQPMEPKRSEAQVTIAQGPAIQLKLAMRKLWVEHIMYTRNFIISSLAELQDQSAVTDRLLTNQDDIGNAIKPYYGNQAGDKLATLLREHILIAADVVTAAKKGDNSGVAAAQRSWTANAREIASFLSAANPAWPQLQLEQMLQKHLDLTTDEVVSRLRQDWTADIDAFDMGHDHMLMFADMLADGISKQFALR